MKPRPRHVRLAKRLRRERHQSRQAAERVVAAINAGPRTISTAATIFIDGPPVATSGLVIQAGRGWFRK